MQSQKVVSDYFTSKQILPFSLDSWWKKLYVPYILLHYFILKGLFQTKIIEKSVILFWLNNMM